MNAEKNVVNQKHHGEQAGHLQQRVMRPTVDIFENGQAIQLYANLPGVTESGLSLEVDGDTLSISGDISIDMPEDLKSLHADVRATRYERAFTLSDELDTAAISANLKDGVLAVSIPKREEVKPRRIEISVD